MLAEGTNAVVYKGEYRSQSVAIKVLKQALDPRQMADFTHEFDLLSKLRSPYVILFYGTWCECVCAGALLNVSVGASVNDETNKLSMVFEFCSNGSLQDVMKKDTVKWDWDRFFRFSIQVRCLATVFFLSCMLSGGAEHCFAAQLEACHFASRRQVTQFSGGFLLEHQSGRLGTGPHSGGHQ